MTAAAGERNSSEPLDKSAPTRTVCLSWKSLSDTFAGDFTAVVRSESLPRSGGGVGPGRLVWIAALRPSVTFHPLASSRRERVTFARPEPRCAYLRQSPSLYIEASGCAVLEP